MGNSISFLKKFTIITISIIVFAGAVIYYLFRGLDSWDTSPLIERDKIVVSQDTIHFISKTWGITGNHQVIYITDYYKQQKAKFDPENDFMYIVQEPIFFKTRSDSLIIYTSVKANRPPRSKLRVRQVGVPGYHLSEYKENYCDMGLKIFGS